MSEPYKILIVDDESEYRDTYRVILENKGFYVETAASAQEALDILEREYYPIVLTDVIMPVRGGMALLEDIARLYPESVEVIMVTGYGSVETAVEAMRKGAFGYFIKSHNPEELLAEIDKAKKLVKLQTRSNIAERQREDSRYLNQTKSPKMQEILSVVEAVSASSANVLLLGESGVGKEVFAQMIHGKSSRATMPFVAINCQSFSDSLLESELFGHEKGAFTGAAGRRIGRFEEAAGGTIFLDEIGEMSLSTQVKLLRVLENKRIERMGSNKSIHVDFRLINATNRILSKEVRSGGFREDLYYRINTLTIEIPPLRERREDLGDMIRFFIAQQQAEMKKEIRGIDEETMRYLLSYDYPGNIRELKNIIERLVVLSRDGMLRINPGQKSSADETQGLKIPDALPFRDARRIFEKEYIRKVMQKADNNITQAAKVMDISRRQLFNKLVEYNLNEK